MKIDENYEYESSDVNNKPNQGNNKDNNVTSNKKPRGSRYRGVSRNGNQWQVKIKILLIFFRY